jgi:hypothetical protein
MEYTIRKNKNLSEMIRDMIVGESITLRNSNRLSVMSICSRIGKSKNRTYTTTVKGLRNAVKVERVK